MKHPMVDKLMQQLKDYMRELTVDIPKQLKFARSLGDLSENAEYKMTKERQLFVESRIKQLEELLKQVRSINIDSLPRDRVAYGSRVVVEDIDTEKRTSYLLVFSGEEPVYKKDTDILVTMGSPVSRALYGKTVGDEVHVILPKGSFDWEIISIETFYDLMDEYQNR